MLIGMVGTRSLSSGAHSRDPVALPTLHDTIALMEWTDEGIVLGVRRPGASSAIVELLTRGHGRHLGLARGGAGSPVRPLLPAGNSVRAVWPPRLRAQLCYYALWGSCSLA